MLGQEGVSSIELSMAWFKQHWDDIVVPLYVGTAFYSTVVSYLLYLLANKLWILSAKREYKQRKHTKDKR